MVTQPAPAYAHPTRKNVSCVDALGRPKSVATYIVRNRVVLLAPPAEAVTLTPEAARSLATDLVESAASIETVRQEHDCRVAEPVFGTGVHD